jgi:hypothetical protein
MEKYCKNCNSYKNFDQYHKHKKGQFGLYPICKMCRKNNLNINKECVSIKVCNTCKKRLNSNFFYKNKNTSSGLTSNCKECYHIKRSENQSRIENYMKIIVNKFKRKNKINFGVFELIRKYNQQGKKCFISNHNMTHLIDTKGRTDNIYNASIIPIKKKDIYNIEDVKLGINLFYSVGKKYDMDTNNILRIYNELTNN